MLREFAVAADEEADGDKGARWSYRRDLGDVRLLVIDSRCGRILDDGDRSMVADAEFSWIEEQVDGDYDHLLIGTSLPWLLPRALHDLESWNEAALLRGRAAGASPGGPRSSAGRPTSSTGRRSASPSTGWPSCSAASAAASTPRTAPARPRPSACCPGTCTTPTPRGCSSPTRLSGAGVTS